LKKIDRIDEDVLQSFFSILFSQSFQSCLLNLFFISLELLKTRNFKPETSNFFEHRTM